jgi:hypothetical protein
MGGDDDLRHGITIDRDGVEDRDGRIAWADVTHVIREYRSDDHDRLRVELRPGTVVMPPVVAHAPGRWSAFFHSGNVWVCAADAVDEESLLRFCPDRLIRHDMTGWVGDVDAEVYECSLGRILWANVTEVLVERRWFTLVLRDGGEVLPVRPARWRAARGPTEPRVIASENWKVGRDRGIRRHFSGPFVERTG